MKQLKLLCINVVVIEFRMMLKVYAALVLSSFVVTLVSCQSNASNCTSTDVNTYIVHNLPPNCASNLDNALNANISSPEKDELLAITCTENCFGRLANWLLGQCGHSFSATSLYLFCLQTSNTASVGRYCQYAIPPLFNAGLEFGNVHEACVNAISLGMCTDGCANQLQSFANQLGCCYQSIYNNTMFLRDAVAIDVLTQEDERNLLAFSQLWSFCSVTPPSICTAESFSFPTGESFSFSTGELPTGRSVSVLPQQQVFMLMMIAAALVG